MFLSAEQDSTTTNRLDSRGQPSGRQQRRKGTPVRLGHSTVIATPTDDTSDEFEPPTPSDDDQRSVKSEPLSANTDEVDAPVEDEDVVPGGSDRPNKSSRSRSKLRCSARLASVLVKTEMVEEAKAKSRVRPKTNETDSNAGSDDNFVIGNDDGEDVDGDDNDAIVPEGDEVESGQVVDDCVKPKKDPKMFRCPHCPYEINNKVRYKVHMSKHDKSITIHRCQFCHEPFQTAEKLTLHVGRRHANGPTTYKCVHCQGLFTTTNYRRYHRHLRSEHGVTGRGDKAAQIIRCPDCDYTCLFASELVQHRPRHDKVKRFKCQLCDYASVRPFDLVKHSRIKHDDQGCGHDGGDCQSQLRTFVCETCGFATYTISKLANHRLKHTGDKPYQCKLCPKAFRDRTTFRRHGRVHQPGYGSYACLVCGQVFKRRHFMVGHLLRVHQIELPADQDEVTVAATTAATTSREDAEERGEPETPLVEENVAEPHEQLQEASLFRCSICQKAFKSWNSLNTHLKRVHSTNLL